MNTTDIEGMSIAERIQAMEAIWASLLNSDSDLESPKTSWPSDANRSTKPPLNSSRYAIFP
jgi:hypothetical protein